MSLLQALGVAMVTVGATGLIMLAGWVALRYEHRYQERHRHDDDEA